MKMLSLLISACILFFGLTSCDEPRESGGGTVPPLAGDDTPALFSFAPNQTAGSPWYRPGGEPVNGHLDESFGHGDLWPELRRNLKASGGTFSVFAAEIGHMSTQTGLIPLLKEDGIPISVEMPGFTQCIPGTDLGNAELNGEAVGGTDNIFARIFRIVNPSDRPDPDGKGWFFTHDRQHFIPDEILFDERQPNLCPEFDPVVLAATKGTWEERKNAARKANGCSLSRRPFNDLLAGLRQDYVDFLQVAKAKWGEDMPAVSIHWNVIAGWEWRDENGIDAVHEKDPAYFNIADNFGKMALDRPSYNSVEYCNQLVDALTEAGFKPKNVLMDVDWMYSVPYITHVLLAHKEALKKKGVQMGINIVDASSYLSDTEELYYNGTILVKRSAPGNSPSVCYGNTLIAIMKFLKGSGIYERGMQIRVTSWLPKPKEKGEEVNENIPGSMAHIANEIYKLL